MRSLALLFFFYGFAILAVLTALAVLGCIAWSDLGVGMGIGLAVCSAVAFAAPDRVGEFAADNTTALASFGVILALAMALAAGVTRTLRR